MRKHPVVQMLLVGAIVSAIGTAGVLAMDWFPVQASREAHDIDRLYDILLIFSIPIFVLVMSVAIYSVWKFRVRPGDQRDGTPIHGSSRLEALWVTIPFLIVAGLGTYSWIVLDDIEAKQPRELRVNVTGQQFAWSFEYPQRGARPVRSNQLYLPVGRRVVFKIRSTDVIHSFWVPAFRLKSDAVPGIATTVRVTPERAGSYSIVCAELCGIGHATMRQLARVVPPREFSAWLRKRGSSSSAAGRGGGRRSEAGESTQAEDGNATAPGKQIFSSAETGCDGCHTLADAGATGTVGPKLDDLATAARSRRPGVSAERYVRESIERPDAFVVSGFPADTMPSDFKQRLKPEEIDALVTYLLSNGKAKGAGK